MNKPGDIITIFGNPIKCTQPIDQARLHKFVQDCGKLEQWLVEYLNDEGHFYEALIRKEDVITTHDFQEIDRAEEERK